MKLKEKELIFNQHSFKHSFLVKQPINRKIPMTKTFIRRIFLSFTLAISYYSVSMAIDGDYNPLLAKQAIATIKNLHITSSKDLINDRDNDDEINLKESKGKEEVTEEKIPQDYELEKEKVLKNFLSSIDKSLYKEYFEEAFNNNQ